MKSAYELAMSRLENTQPSTTLSEEQKKALAEIDSEIDAKIAEQHLFLESEIAKASNDEETISQLRHQLAGECAALNEKRELKKDKIRSGAN